MALDVLPGLDRLLVHVVKPGRLRVGKSMTRDRDDASRDRSDHMRLDVFILVQNISVYLNLLLIGAGDADNVVAGLFPLHVDSSRGHGHLDRLGANLVLNVDRLKSRHCREEVCESLAGNDLVPVAGSNVQRLDGRTELGILEGSHELGTGLAA